MEQAFVGVDVGTASVRAGIFDAEGELVATARRPIAIWHEAGDIVEQSSADIWEACTGAIRAVLTETSLPPSRVKGIGFDATCSLVVLDRAGNPLTVSASGDRQRNVVVWMDHRATAEANRISATGDEVLRHVGGVISPEMETPKLLWLKQHLPATYRDAGHFFDLADYLTYRATGRTTRSMCTLTCKWTYLAHEGAGAGATSSGSDWPIFSTATAKGSAAKLSHPARRWDAVSCPRSPPRSAFCRGRRSAPR